ncbi:MAG: membrane protein insertion efficiency factor YidD [Gammaproteobacteria bacterium]|nr:membrane protein insertion efficiency factor YidD [Gammaproteobacteria bacterium]
MGHSLILLLRVYRYTLSPIFGNQCRFYPTCSRYAEQAIKEKGAIWGLFLTARRLAKCHPWHPGGIDPVPDQIREQV